MSNTTASKTRRLTYTTARAAEILNVTPRTFLKIAQRHGIESAYREGSGNGHVWFQGDVKTLLRVINRGK